MLVLVATLVFLVSPSESPRYKAALEAVHSLRDASLENFHRFQKALLEKSGNRAELWRFLQMGRMDAPIMVSRELATTIRKGIPADLSEMITPDWTLRRYQGWISENLKKDVTSYTLDGKQVRAKLQDIAQVNENEFRCLSDGAILTELNTLNGIRSGRTLRGKHFVDVSMTRHESLDCGSPGGKVQVRLPAQPLRVKESNLLAYLIQHSDFPINKILSEKNGEFAFLPSAEGVWPEIMDRTISDAIRYLKQSAIRTENKLQVFGVSVSSSVVSIIAPLVIFALSMGLCSYLQHIVFLTNKNNYQLAREFPWFILFRDPLSRTIAILNVFIFPLVTCLAILVLFSSGEIVKLSLGILLNFFLGLSAARNIYLVQKLSTLTKEFARRRN